MHSLSAATARDFVREIAEKTSDEHGRQAHAFTKREDIAFEAAEMKARNFLADVGLIENRDFRVDTDAIGNMLITVYGADTSKTVMSGSHVDSVLNGGKHDGVDGVASALAYLQHFVKGGRKGTNYTFVVFRAEESSPMTGEACLGSKVMTGMIPEERLRAVTYGLERENRKLLEQVFGPRKWQAILEERDNPWVRQSTLYLPSRSELNDKGGVRDMEVIGYNELHIEQSAVLNTGRYEAGIVTHIGGSTNRQFALDSSHLPSTKIETYNSPRSVWSMTFLGEEAHTGGTPHNARAKYGSNTNWHRHDALVGASTFLSELLAAPQTGISVSSLSIPKETGFTTVPAVQKVIIHAPVGQAQEAQEKIMRIAQQTCEEKGITFECQVGVESTRPVVALDSEAIKKHIQIPLIVEENARKISREVESLFGGDVRGTATDFVVNENGLRMNLNTRDINPKKRDQLLLEIREQMEHVGINAPTLFGAKATVTEHIPLDADMVRVAEEEAWSLGLNALTMPSQPSHDAASMQKAGAPTGMVFESHSGASHIATESVGDRQQEDAISLHHAILDRYTENARKPLSKLRKLR